MISLLSLKPSRWKYVLPLAAALAGGGAKVSAQQQADSFSRVAIAQPSEEQSMEAVLKRETGGVLRLMPNSPTSLGFQQAALQGYLKLPAHLRAILQDDQIRIWLVRFVDEVNDNGVRPE